MIYYCANCGEPFVVIGDRWGYAYDGDFTCSYHCMRAMRRADLEGEEYMVKEPKYHMMTDEEKAVIRDLRDKGLSYRAIADTIGGGINYKTVGAYCVREKIGCHANNEPNETKPEKISPFRSKAEEVPEQETEADDLQEESVIRIDKARIADILMDIAQILISIYKSED